MISGDGGHFMETGPDITRLIGARAVSPMRDVRGW